MSIRQSANNASPDVKPHDQGGGKQGKRHQHRENADADALDGDGAAGRLADVALGRLCQPPDDGCQLRGQARVFSQVPLRFADQGKFQLACRRNRMRPLDVIAHMLDLFFEQATQLRVHPRRRRVESSPRPPELKRKNVQPLQIRGRRFDQHV